MACLYSDEQFPRSVSEKLRNMGHDILTCQESGRAGMGIEDNLVLAFAISKERAVLTFNRRHFKRLHTQFPDHFGIIMCTKNDNSEQLAQCIHKALQAYPSLDGELVRVYKPG